MPIVILTLFHAVVFAQNSTIPMIEDLNQKVKMSEPACEFCSRDYGLFQKCIARICPQLKENKTDPGPTLEAKDLPKGADQLMQTFKEYIATHGTLFPVAEFHIRKAKAGEYPKKTRVSALAAYISFHQDAVKELGPSLMSSEEIPQSALKDYFDQALERDMAGHKKLTEQAMQMARNKRLLASGFDQLGAAYKYRALYPSLTFQEAARKDAEETQKLLKSASSEVKELVRTTGLEESLNYHVSKLSNSKQMIDEVDGGELQATTDEIQWAVLSSQYLANDWPLADEIVEFQNKKSTRILKNSDLSFLKAEKLSEPLAKFSASELQTQLLFNQLAVQPSKDLNVLKMSKVEMAYAACITQTLATAQSLPKTETLKSFDKTIPSIRSQFKSRLANKFSEGTRAALRKYIDNLDFNLPPDQEGYLKDVIEMLNSRMRQIRQIRTDFDRGISSPTIIPLNIALNLTDDLKNICDKIDFPAVRDNTVSSLGAALVGSKSVINPEFGESLLAHEVGHGLYALLQANGQGISEESHKKAKQAEKCLVEKHKRLFEDLKAKTPGHPAEKEDDLRKTNHYVGEDAADSLAGILSDSNFVCGFRLPGTELDSYDLETDPTFSPDKHSTNGFRMFMVEMHSQRGLPYECREYMRQEKYSSQPCF